MSTTLTVAQMVHDGYTREHAEDYVARLSAPRPEPPPAPPAAVNGQAANGSAPRPAKRTRRSAKAATGRRPRSAASRAKSADVRQWAADNGIPCASHGRIPVSVLERYDSAH